MTTQIARDNFKLRRRRFLQFGSAAAFWATSRALLAGVAVGPSLRLGCVTGAVKEELKKDWQGTLRRVAGLGYKELEFSERIGPTDLDCRRMLDDLGMKAIAGGATFTKLASSLPEVIRHSHSLGKEFVACYWPWLDGGEKKKLEDYRLVAHNFNELGRKLQVEGLRFVFHHHDIEFLPVDGRIPCDVLLEKTDPSLVSMELDVFWAGQAGMDAARYLEANRPRVALLHLGDRSKTGERKVYCLGEGNLDLVPILEAARKSPNLHVMIENPDAVNGMACLATGYQQVRNLGF